MGGGGKGGRKGGARAKPGNQLVLPDMLAHVMRIQN